MEDYYRIKAEVVTRKHVQRVSELLGKCAADLVDRGANHDNTKYDDPELGALAIMQEQVDQKGYAPYNSPEYMERMLILTPMLEHHYANNRHHPEHFPNGVNDMTLFDIVEMFVDWKAASERGGDSLMRISHATKRYGIDSQLAAILYNTANYMNFDAE